MCFDIKIVNWTILIMKTGWLNFALEMTLYRFIGIQFEENMLIGFRCNTTRATKRRDLCLIHLPVELSHLN